MKRIYVYMSKIDLWTFYMLKYCTYIYFIFLHSTLECKYERPLNSAQIPPYPIFDFFSIVFTLILGQVCPAGLGKRFRQGPAWLEPPRRGQNQKKKEKSKMRKGGGVICDPRAIQFTPYCHHCHMGTDFKSLQISTQVLLNFQI